MGFGAQVARARWGEFHARRGRGEGGREQLGRRLREVDGADTPGPRAERERGSERKLGVAMDSGQRVWAPASCKLGEIRPDAAERSFQAHHGEGAGAAWAGRVPRG